MAKLASGTVLIGPSSPLFKGGIAHYTYSLYKELIDQKIKVDLISISRPYPKFLFPGATLSDNSRHKFSLEKEHALIDWLNPLSYLKTYWFIKNKNPDTLIIQWWTWFFTLPFLVILWLVKKFLKTKIVIIAHNPVDHEQALYKSISSKLVLSLADKIIVPNLNQKESLEKIFNLPITLGLHPLYTMFEKTNYTQKKAQKKLNINCPTLLFFGHVRPYKGLDILLESLDILWKKNIKINLLIAGEFWQKEQIYIDKIKPEFRKYVVIKNNYIKNEDVSLYFTAVDAVAIPYLSGTGSGPAKIALSFNKPIIATDVGDNPDLFKIATPGVLVECNNKLALAEAILKVIKNKNNYTNEITKLKRQLTWTNLVNKIYEN